MTEDYSFIDDIIISFLKDDITPAEKEVMEKWLVADPANKKYFKKIYKIWNSLETTDNNSRDVDQVLEKVKLRLQKADEKPARKINPARKVTLMLGKWAAVILISVTAGALLNHYFSDPITTIHKNKVYSSITVPLGSKSKIHLPDGTEVVLNAGSKLSYGPEYGAVLREVELEGEGYFKVAKQKSKPFIVHTSKMNVKALGTEFNVKAYPDEDLVETILVEGSVEVNEVATSDSHEISKSVILKPGQKMRIYKSGINLRKQTKDTQDRNALVENDRPLVAKGKVFLEMTNTQIETSWKDNRWIIKGEDLNDLAVLFSRRFNINIQLEDKELGKYRFSGTIQNETVEQVFEIMQLTIPISYAIDKGFVTWSINQKLEKEYKEAYQNN